MSIFASIRTAIEKRAAYNRIKSELANMRTETAIDLGLFKDDAAKTAARVVYG